MRGMREMRGDSLTCGKCEGEMRGEMRGKCEGKCEEMRGDNARGQPDLRILFFADNQNNES